MTFDGLRPRATFDNSAPTPLLDDFLVAYDEDDNVWWVMECGHHQNLFEAAADRLDQIRQLYTDTCARTARGCSEDLDLFLADLSEVLAGGEDMRVLAQPLRGEYRAYMHHPCGALEWMTDEDKAEAGGGCDACESGSTNHADWQPIFTPNGHGGGEDPQGGKP